MTTTVARTQPSVNQLVLRDGQQSTLRAGVINFNPIDWAKILSRSNQAGFKAAEVAGGQSFQSAIQQGLNPFNIMEHLDLCTRDAQGKRSIDLQMLFRGANALGFRHYSPDLIEAVLSEFTRLGINKIRLFDALNDIDNIYIPESLKEKTKGADPIELQGALCFGHYASQPDRYTDDYYANYAQALIWKGCTSIAIKDMSGQLDAERATALIGKLKQSLPGIKLELHIHSTDEVKSRATVQAAIAAGVDGIETVEGPLSGGAAHHSLVSIDPSKAEDPKYQALVAETERVFSKLTREDAQVTPEIKAKLCAAGVPGGAMPFVLKDLKEFSPQIAHNNQQFFIDRYSGTLPEMLKDTQWLLNKSIELFLKELPRVCRDAGFPLLVTPTADICTKQAIRNLMYGTRVQADAPRFRYNLTDKRYCDERFVKLVLGHYGQMKSYQSTEDRGCISPEKSVKEYFKWNKLGIKEQVEHPYLAMLEQHVVGNGELASARQQADDLITQYGYKALSFASREQLAMMNLLSPPGLGDTIKTALEKYIAKTKKDYYQARDFGTPFTKEGFEYLFEPLFKHIDVLAALGKKPAKALSMKLADFGNLGTRLYEVYSSLPAVKTIREFLAEKQTDYLQLIPNFNYNYQVLDKVLKTLFKQSIEDFKAVKLKDLITDLAKLSKISDLLKDSRKSGFDRDANFITSYIKDKDKIAGVGKKLSRAYFPLLEKQTRWHNAPTQAV